MQDQPAPPQFHVGQQVILTTKRQGSYRGGRPSAATQVWEVAQAIWQEQTHIFPATWTYRLRRPGAITKGGQVHHDEATLTAA